MGRAMNDSPEHIRMSAMTTEGRNATMGWLIAAEGNIGLGKSARRTGRLKGTIRLRPVIQISNTQRRMLDEVKEAFGGTVYVNGYYLTRKGRKMVYNWVVSRHTSVVNILDAVLPYLPFKNRQAEIVREYCISRLGRNAHSGRYSKKEIALWRRMQLLNSKGGKAHSRRKVVGADAL